MCPKEALRNKMSKHFAQTQSQFIGPLLISLITFSVVLVYWPTFYDLILEGKSTGNYTHRIFVMPIFLIAIWRIRFDLGLQPVKPCWLGLLALFAGGALWLVGELAFIQVLRNLAAILMLAMAILTILGYRWFVTAIFPLFFLVFAVPFYGPIVPFLVDLTAAFAFNALQFSGVLVYREGPHFELSSGRWSIVDACSGIEYLSAVTMFATLFAWTVFDENRKRVAFVAGAIVLGIIGNWLRAYLTMLIAHVTGNQFLRESHGTFGWYLFAVLLFFYCMAGWNLRNDSVKSAANGAPEMAFTRGAAATVGGSWQLVLVCICTLLVILAWPFLRTTLSQASRTETVQIPRIKTAGGWIETSNNQTDWKPALTNPTRQSVQTFERRGTQVSVHFGLFANEDWHSKLVSSVNKLVDSESRKWSVVSTSRTNLTLAGRAIRPKTGSIVGGQQRVVAWHWYSVNGQPTADDFQAKLWQLSSRLRGEADVGVWVALSTPITGSDQSAESVLRDFAESLGPQLVWPLEETHLE